MPELPEVETTVRDLRGLLIGRTITGITFADWSKMLVTHPVEVMSQLIAGEEILAVERRAKFVILKLSNDKNLLFHRKMTGNLFWRQADDEPDRFTHVVIGLTDGTELRFADMRKFGKVYLFLSEEELLSFFGNLGPEPLLEDFTLEIFDKLITPRKGNLKSLLLDQSVLVGLGNIYVNEALFVSGLHPQRRTESLTAEEKRKLYEAIRMVLEKGIKNRGTTLSDYLDANGERGSNQEHLFVHFREGELCETCGSAIIKIKVAQRGTYLCPTCQPINQ